MSPHPSVFAASSPHCLASWRPSGSIYADNSAPVMKSKSQMSPFFGCRQNRLSDQAPSGQPQVKGSRLRTGAAAKGPAPVSESRRGIFAIDPDNGPVSSYNRCRRGGSGRPPCFHNRSIGEAADAFMHRERQTGYIDAARQCRARLIPFTIRRPVRISDLPLTAVFAGSSEVGTTSSATRTSSAR